MGSEASVRSSADTNRSPVHSIRETRSALFPLEGGARTPHTVIPDRPEVGCGDTRRLSGLAELRGATVAVSLCAAPPPGDLLGDGPEGGGPAPRSRIAADRHREAALRHANDDAEPQGSPVSGRSGCVGDLGPRNGIPGDSPYWSASAAGSATHHRDREQRPPHPDWGPPNAPDAPERADLRKISRSAPSRLQTDPFPTARPAPTPGRPQEMP